MSQYCEGCPMYIKNDLLLGCENSERNDQGECPCSHCIVKPMCDDSCIDFDDWDAQLLYKIARGE